MKANNTINILGLAVILGLSLLGCSDKTNPEGNSDISDNSHGTSVSENMNDSSDSTISDSSPESESKPELSPEKQETLSKLRLKSFVGPDGETVQTTDAADVYKDIGFCFYDGAWARDENGVYIFAEDGGTIYVDDEQVSDVLKYEFAYIRYASPFFYMGDTLDGNARQEKLDSLPKAEWFKAKPGDKLDCGLTVKSAVYERYAVKDPSDTTGTNPVIRNDIEYDGEITVEGVLYTAQSTRDYLTQPGDLVFVPDPTKTSGLPAVAGEKFQDNYNVYFGMGSGDIKFVMADTGYNGWIIGKADEINKDEIFGDEELVYVKVTLTNVKAGGYVNPDMPATYAEIVDIERVERT